MSAIKFGNVEVPRECFDCGKEMKSELICSSCSGIIKDPVQTLCGHRYCKECLMKILQSDKKCTAEDCETSGGELDYDEENKTKVVSEGNG
jgi:hypothetical protein